MTLTDIIVGSGEGRNPPIVIQDIESGSCYDPTMFLITPQYVPAIASVMIPRGLINDRVEKLAMDIREVYGDQEVHLLCILKGSRGFFSQLAEILSRIHRYTGSKHSTVPYLEHYVRIKSYVNTESTGEIQVQSDDLNALRGKHVLIVEDIIDTGNTLIKFVKHLNQFEPKTIRVASLLEKRTPKSAGFLGDFVGFSIPDEFIVGYCLDYNEYFRDLEHICVLNTQGIKNYSVRKPSEVVDEDAAASDTAK